MIKLRAYADEKDLARAVSEFLKEHGSYAAENMKREYPTAEHFYQQSTGNLAECFGQLTQLIDMTMNSQSSARAHELLAKTMIGAWALGTAASVAPEVKQKLAERKTANMRKIRSEKPYERAVREAVAAEHGDGPVPKPAKEASAILSSVNRRLADAGFQPVKLDVVRRRLDKFPRS